MTIHSNPLLSVSNPRPIVRSDYEQLWDMLRASTDGVTIRDVPRTIPSINYGKAKAWLGALNSAGYVSREQISLTRNLPTYRYQLIRDIGQSHHVLTVKAHQSHPLSMRPSGVPSAS